jgi:hypothetical protein
MLETGEYRAGPPGGGGVERPSAVALPYSVDGVPQPRRRSFYLFLYLRIRCCLRFLRYLRCLSMQTTPPMYATYAVFHQQEHETNVTRACNQQNMASKTGNAWQRMKIRIPRVSRFTRAEE